MSIAWPVQQEQAVVKLTHLQHTPTEAAEAKKSQHLVTFTSRLGVPINMLLAPDSTCLL
jgi:hypothetical protein